jgi:hypothetical protein
MMGHTTIRQTQHYAKVLDSSVALEMNILKEKFISRENKLSNLD